MNILLILLPLAALAIYGIVTLVINTNNYNKTKLAIYDRIITTIPQLKSNADLINNTSLKDDIMFSINCVVNNRIKEIDDMIKRNANTELDSFIIKELEACDIKLHLALFLKLLRNENCSPDKILNYIKTKFPDNIVVDKNKFDTIMKMKNIENEIIELCKVTCSEGMTVCDDKCVDLNQPNNYNCGKCGIRCNDEQECTIQESPDSEKVFMCLDKCYDFNTDTMKLCSQNEKCCNNQCINLNNPDNSNCGECGNNCTDVNLVCKKIDQTNNCVESLYCTNDTHCNDTQICCNNQCVNILDNLHCGNCENRCVDTESCTNTLDGYKCMAQVQ